jgi:hypothetical protein
MTRLIMQLGLFAEKPDTLTYIAFQLIEVRQEEQLLCRVANNTHLNLKLGLWVLNFLLFSMNGLK